MCKSSKTIPRIVGNWPLSVSDPCLRCSFCLGDAVHRHPPNHGLGSNTCIQDAHNLAWKVAYVDKGDDFELPPHQESLPLMVD